MTQKSASITIKFTTGDQATCDQVRQVIVDNMKDVIEISYESQFVDHVNEKCTLYLGNLRLLVSVNQLFEVMSKVDFVKSGFASEIIPSLCSDITLSIDKPNDDTNKEVIGYLLNKSQEQDKTISELNDRVSELDSTIDTQEDRISRLETKYLSFYCYINEFINLPKLSMMVADIVDIVDPSLEEKYTERKVIQ